MKQKTEFKVDGTDETFVTIATNNQSEIEEIVKVNKEECTNDKSE